MRRREWIAQCMAGAALAAASSRSRLRAASLVKLQVGAIPRISSSSLHLAQELGFFREAGLEIEVLQVANQLEAMTLLAGGKLDVHFGAISTGFLNAVIKGLPLRIAAGRDLTTGTCGNVGAVYGLRKTFPNGLADATQLKGKRVAAPLAAGIGQFALDAQLARAGLSEKDVTIVRLQFNQMMAALVGGGIDAFVGGDDFERELASDAGIVHTDGLHGIYPKFQYMYIVFGQTMLAPGQDLGSRFLSAYLRGAKEFAGGKTPQFLKQFIQSDRLDEARSMKACRDSYPLDGAIDSESLRLFAGWAAQYKFIPRPVAVSELVDDRFLTKAHAI